MSTPTISAPTLTERAACLSKRASDLEKLPILSRAGAAWELTTDTLVFIRDLAAAVEAITPYLDETLQDAAAFRSRRPVETAADA